MLVSVLKAELLEGVLSLEFFVLKELGQVKDKAANDSIELFMAS